MLALNAADMMHAANGLSIACQARVLHDAKKNRHLRMGPADDCGRARSEGVLEHACVQSRMDSSPGFSQLPAQYPGTLTYKEAGVTLLTKQLLVLWSSM